MLSIHKNSILIFFIRAYFHDDGKVCLGVSWLRTHSIMDDAFFRLLSLFTINFFKEEQKEEGMYPTNHRPVALVMMIAKLFPNFCEKIECSTREDDFSGMYVDHSHWRKMLLLSLYVRSNSISKSKSFFSLKCAGYYVRKRHNLIIEHT